jgi:hypothetical protein
MSFGGTVKIMSAGPLVSSRVHERHDDVRYPDQSDPTLNPHFRAFWQRRDLFFRDRSAEIERNEITERRRIDNERAAASARLALDAEALR